jgi:DNA-directed RNA polymerase subunit RPC12/RpoP
MDESSEASGGETYVCSSCHKSFKLAPKGTESGSRIVQAIKSMIAPTLRCPHCNSADVVHADTARVTTKRQKKKPAIGGKASE